jgi:hypothetical protein
MLISESSFLSTLSEYNSPLKVNSSIGNEKRLESSAEHVRSLHPSEFLLMQLHVVVLTWLDGG